MKYLFLLSLLTILISCNSRIESEGAVIIKNQRDSLQSIVDSFNKVSQKQKIETETQNETEQAELIVKDAAATDFYADVEETPKYSFVLIRFSIIGLTQNNNVPEKQAYLSNIKTFKKIDKSIKYNYVDEIEQAMRKNISNQSWSDKMIKITERIIYTYLNYEEANKARMALN